VKTPASVGNSFSGAGARYHDVASLNFASLDNASLDDAFLGHSVPRTLRPKDFATLVRCVPRMMRPFRDGLSVPSFFPRLFTVSLIFGDISSSFQNLLLEHILSINIEISVAEP
jgi:hypothetical protein